MEKYSLRSQIFHTIREDILKGRYKENDELREVTLGNELGVSRTPVREALRQLELEGLVTIIPNKGAYVRGISEKDVRDIYLIRSTIEGLCIRMASGHMTKEIFEELEETIMRAEFHLAKGNLDNFTELDGKFHEILYQASGSRMLEHVLSDFHKYTQLSRGHSVKEEARAQKTLEEHKEIIAALKENDVAKAESLANKHVLNVMEHLQLNQE